MVATIKQRVIRVFKLETKSTFSLNYLLITELVRLSIQVARPTEAPHPL